jgi:acetylornithine deacetylase
LNGHVDVVPPGDLSHWTTGDPFSGRVAEGRVYGRGAVDMKGGLVAALLAAAALHEAGVGLGGDLILHSVAGEETGDHDIGVNAVIEAGFGGDAAIVGEPTNHDVATVSGGLLWMTLRVQGKAGHNNMRAELVHAGGKGEAAGVNALEKGVYLLTMLQELERQWGQSKSHPLFRPGWFSLHPGVIVGAPEGIMVPFMISTYCNIDYSILYPPNEPVEDIKAEIEQFLLAASQLDPWLRKHPPQVDWRLDWPPFDLDPNHPLVTTTIDAYRHAAGIKPAQDTARIKGFGAVCDATYFLKAGIPAIVHAGGDAVHAHTADEYVEIDRVLLAAKTYALTAINWCGTT